MAKEVDTRYTQDRELSWLRFNERVLEEAKDESVPLMERLKFAAIFTSNLDEFFMIRVGSLYDMTLVKEEHIAPVQAAGQGGGAAGEPPAGLQHLPHVHGRDGHQGAQAGGELVPG